MGNLEYKIINNFLKKEFFDDFKNILFSNKINWFFLPHMTQNDHYFFNHCFYNFYVPQSSFYLEYIEPILVKLEAKGINEVRANLQLRGTNQYQSTFHVDRPFKCKTAILYMNTCNGYTLFEDKKIKIFSEENKILIFDSQIKHAAVSQTDVSRRIVINFNYF